MVRVSSCSWSSLQGVHIQPWPRTQTMSEPVVTKCPQPSVLLRRARMALMSFRGVTFAALSCHAYGRLPVTV
jgi:hypothetical protein